MLVWEGELLAQLIQRDPPIAFNALRVLAQQNQALQRRYQESLTDASSNGWPRQFCGWWHR